MLQLLQVSLIGSRSLSRPISLFIFCITQCRELNHLHAPSTNNNLILISAIDKEHRAQENLSMYPEKCNKFSPLNVLTDTIREVYSPATGSGIQCFRLRNTNDQMGMLSKFTTFTETPASNSLI